MALSDGRSGGRSDGRCPEEEGGVETIHSTGAEKEKERGLAAAHTWATDGRTATETETKTKTTTFMR